MLPLLPRLMITLLLNVYGIYSTVVGPSLGLLTLLTTLHPTPLRIALFFSLLLLKLSSPYLPIFLHRSTLVGTGTTRRIFKIGSQWTVCSRYFDTFCCLLTTKKEPHPTGPTTEEPHNTQNQPVTTRHLLLILSKQLTPLCLVEYG